MLGLYIFPLMPRSPILSRLSARSPGATAIVQFIDLFEVKRLDTEWVVEIDAVNPWHR